MFSDSQTEHTESIRTDRMKDMEQEQRTRTVIAPQPMLSGTPPPNQVIEVQLAEDEEVEWTWTTLPGGQRYVSGYTIHEKLS